ncbi:hypothetical protein K450DRAFT_226679 [Umbelopsis ramanniana AG]|uniref:Inositol polyphosphate-related phosphatase domain-containing protein n=1 Tax=Umbelopsis ramanniana AG TaxID=1314678 RepID=A0AAD5EGD0_UMBRA|nr:uncharacterized protein K450DRAFT_226679 [Umbelopsis ramanniana AG]KAI8582739.1 hypothetical protein K450DRAFT_226679 [Umbelopsis ramanniana AG]
MDEPDESTPVSFKALKERWQKQESSVSPKSVENSSRQSPLNTPPKGTYGVAVTPPSKSPAPPVSKTAPRPASENANEPSNKPPVLDAKRSVPVITPEILAKKGTPPPPPSMGLARPSKPKEDIDTNVKPAQMVKTDEIDNEPPKRVSMLSQQFEVTSLQSQQRNGTFTYKSVPTPKEAVLVSKPPKSQPEDIFERPAEASHRHPSFDPRVDSGTLKTVMSPEQLVDKASDNSNEFPSPFDEELDSDEDSDEEAKHTSVKQKRAPPPPPPSRRTRIAQLHQNPEASPLQSSQPSSQVQDTLRHIPVKPMLTDQPTKPPRLDAAATEKPPVSLDHNRSMHILEQPAPLLPPRPILANRTHNDFEAVDPTIMSNIRQSPKPLARARTIGAGSLDAAPPLPTRPMDSRASSISRSSTIHSSTDSRTLGTSEGSLSDQSSPGLRRSQTIARTERLLGAKIYPDHANANRSPPYIHGSPLTVHHRGPVKLFAISGQHVITGTQNTRIYNASTGINTATIDHTASNDINNRVCSMAFPPSLSFADEGRYLWLGMQDGAILVVDVLKGDIIGKRTDVHSAPITNMLRYGNEEIWTIDDAGHMNAWPVIKGSRGHTNHPLEIHPRREHVSSKLNFAIIVEQQLWMASGRVLDVYDVKLSGGSTNRIHTRVPNNVGNVTQLAAVPYHRDKVFVGHDDGKVTVWDTATLEITQTISLSIYGVSCMQAVGEYYLWAGYNTGMIYVYDTRPERWEVVKMWKGHGAQVLHMLLDETPLVKDNDLIQVASLDGNGTIQIWDGLLSDNWRDQAMNKRMKEYCDYRDAKILISSWNIDANKPEKFDAQDEQKIREWLTSLRDPDIIVVGIQEIVDLESKKQTAKSFFSTKKKSSVPMEEEEMLTHRYRLWHNYLVHVLATEYGQDCYTVVKTEQLVGLFSCIFVRTSEAGRVFDKHSTVVKTGLKVMSKSIHGNKGGIAIRFLFDHTSMCFVNCHLAAGQTHVRQRNSDAEGILQLASLEPLPQYYDVFVNGGDGAFVLDHELCFMSGDFNYRIDMGREQVIKLLSSPNKDAAYATLQAEDQLRKQKIVYPLFKLLLFQEAPIRFDPTYKYDPGTDFYDRSEKKRIPAWCDRILYRGPDIKSEYYRRHEARASDHRPISSGFLVKVKTIDDQRRDRIMEKVELAWHQTLEKLIQKKKLDWLMAYGVYNQYEAQQELASANWNMMEALQT